MSYNFIHYVRREVRCARDAGKSPFYAELQSDLAGLSAPQYHTTRAFKGPAIRVGQGDTIWLVGQLFSPWGRLPPSIDARIDVAAEPQVVWELNPEAGNAKRKQLRFEAAETSRWFPLADASAVLSGLLTRNTSGTVSPLTRNMKSPIGYRLQQMRELASNDLLCDWEALMDVRGFDFVSYRLRDGTHAAFLKVQSILSGGGAVFWDRWSLPRRLAERREALNPPALDEHLRIQIGRARKVWGIQSKLYGEPDSYSAREMILARQLGKFVEFPV